MLVRAGDLARAFFAVAALLVPWTLYLAVTLPRHYPAHRYWLGWVGFDLALVAILVVTGVSMMRGRPAVSRYAAVAATMLVVDAWFDVVNSASSTDLLVAASTAVLFELPLAYLCWRLARGDSRPVEESSAGSGTGRDFRP
ncbi:MAG: hypothetical protein WB797_17825 [Nocardioides sp.]